MSVNQISVFLENKPGILCQLTEALAEAGINMRAITLAESTNFGVVRILAENTQSAMNVLIKEGFVAGLTPVLAYEIPNEAGGLNSLLKKISEADINVKYMYSCLSSEGSSRAIMIFRVDNAQEAEEKLSGMGLVSLTDDQM